MILVGQMGSHNQSTSSGPSWVLTVQWLVWFAFAVDWCCWSLSGQYPQHGCHGRTYTWPPRSQLFAIAHQAPALREFCPTSSPISASLCSAWGIWKPLDSLCGKLGPLPQLTHWTTFFYSCLCCMLYNAGHRHVNHVLRHVKVCHQPHFPRFRAPHPAWMFVQYLHYVLCQWLQIRH